MKKEMVLSLAVVLLLSLLVVTPAFATTPEDASGEYTLLEMTDEKAVFASEGTFVGTMTEYYSPGKADEMICDPCKVGDKEGSVSFKIIRINYNQNLGHFTTLSATGDLVGIHFQGEFAINDTFTGGVYWGKIHFDPK